MPNLPLLINSKLLTNDSFPVSCSEGWNDIDVRNHYWVCMFVFAFCIPLVCMLASCVFMNHIIKKQASFAENQSGVNNIRHQKIFWKLFLLVVTFTICAGFQHVLFLVNTFFHLTISTRTLTMLHSMSSLVVTFQAAINPFIYENLYKKISRACIKVGALIRRNLFSDSFLGMPTERLNPHTDNIRWTALDARDQ